MSNHENEPKETSKNYQDLMKEMKVEDSTAADTSLSSKELEKRVEELEAALEQQKNEVLRTHAEMENVRKRVANDISKAHKFALERFANEMLPVVDSLERGLQVDAKDNELAKNIHKGMELTLELLTKTLEKSHITAICPKAGEAFNPALHQAMSMQEQAGAEPNTIIQVLQKGYLLHDRLLRPALVIVTKPH